MKNGDVRFNPYTDSHEELVYLFLLRDTKIGNFARVEFSPATPDKIDDPASYKLQVDESVCPEWFTDAKQAKAATFLRSVVKRMVINSPVKGLCGGAYILTKGADVSWVRATRIIVMRENSKVGALRENSKVGVLWGNSQVGELRENSQVGVLWENSQVGVLWENSKVVSDKRPKPAGETNSTSK